MSSRYLLTKTVMLNVPNQVRLLRTQLMRKVILEGRSPRTRHGPNSQLVIGIALLNNARWLKEKGKKESNKSFTVKAKKYLLTSYGNGNVY